MRTYLWAAVAVLVLVAGFAAVARFGGGPAADHFAPPEQFPPPEAVDTTAAPVTEVDGTATFGSGCFWCTEAVFERLKGVSAVESGYSGGHDPHPTYERVCRGSTGHAEVVRVTFDPAVISYPELLEVFWRSHDPTTPDRQGADFGPQYRSVIFTHTERQRRLAEGYKQKIDAAKVYAAPVVTEIRPAGPFHPAEAYHQDYFAVNGRNPYCRAVIRPKLEALDRVFADRRK